MREGSEGEDVLALRRRLAEEGFDVAPVDNPQFDEQLKTAVLEFQESSQVPETGATDSATREALVISARTRLAALARTLQQWRESPARRSFGNYYVHVNIPAFHADVRDERETIYHYRVVVGKNSFDWSETVTETPTFSDRIERIVFNPFWHLPKSIIHNEVIPAVEENPDYIEEQNYEVRKRGSRIFIKQLPGPGNALGRVKFLFPNQFAVYMHDTPTRHLFSRVKRDFSHGCVRVHEPLELATLLIQRDRQWTRAQIDNFIQDALRKPDEDTIFHLDTPVPIHLDYLLARVDEHGYVEFYDDVYDRDSEALAQQERAISEWLDIAI
jgi:murein L,D-transpeptidase YcbB/YkuD